MKYCLAVIILLFPSTAFAGDYGKFIGSVVVEWVDGDRVDRDMKILEEFKYQDSKNNFWIVPKGTIINGASIPRIFWTLIGAPFVGNYRQASVVHDYYCQAMTRQWKDVHRMFYYASLAGGVSIVQAKIMYLAVYAGGPRWISSSPSCYNCHAPIEDKRKWNPSVDERQIENLSEWIRKSNPSVQEIDEKVDLIVKKDETKLGIHY